MSILRIDHVVVPVPSVEGAAEPYERLGLRLTPLARHQGQGTENRVFFAGSADESYVEFLGIHDRAAALGSSRGPLYLDAIERGSGLARIMLAVDDFAPTLASLAAAGFEPAPEPVYRERGDRIADVAALDGLPGLGISVGLICYAEPLDERLRRHAEAGLFDHAFPLKRLDHLAVLAPDPAAAIGAWAALGLPVTGEVRGRGMVIHQVAIGDAILELLAPATPESPLASRPPGIASMCAWEVADLEAAVAHARDRGFTPSDPTDGILPGTRVSTIPAPELAGLAMQLLQYV